jgi:hypothetical protein
LVQAHLAVAKCNAVERLVNFLLGPLDPGAAPMAVPTSMAEATQTMSAPAIVSRKPRWSSLQVRASVFAKSDFLLLRVSFALFLTHAGQAQTFQVLHKAVSSLARSFLAPCVAGTPPSPLALSDVPMPPAVQACLVDDTGCVSAVSFVSSCLSTSLYAAILSFSGHLFLCVPVR